MKQEFIKYQASMRPWIRSFLMGLALMTPAGVFSATLTGTVIANEDGKPVPAILTLHDLSTPRTLGSAPFDHQFSSKTDGTFSLTNVPAGKYEICVDAPSQTILDPCEWTPGGAPKITVTDTPGNGNGRGNAAGAAMTQSVQIKVNRGYMLQVRLNDPQRLLPEIAPGGAGGNTVLLRLLTPDSRSHNFRLLSADAGGQSRFTIVPYNGVFTLAVDAPGTTEGVPTVTLSSAASASVGTGPSAPDVGPPSSAPGSSQSSVPVLGNFPFNSVGNQSGKGSARIPMQISAGQSSDPIVFNVSKH